MEVSSTERKNATVKVAQFAGLQTILQDSAGPDLEHVLRRRTDERTASHSVTMLRHDPARLPTAFCLSFRLRTMSSRFPLPTLNIHVVSQSRAYLKSGFIFGPLYPRPLS